VPGDSMWTDTRSVRVESSTLPYSATRKETTAEACLGREYSRQNGDTTKTRLRSRWTTLPETEEMKEHSKVAEQKPPSRMEKQLCEPITVEPLDPGDNVWGWLAITLHWIQGQYGTF